MDNELLHYGILGMKWGVRRYQNYDGTLTSAGKKRYGGDGDGDGDSVRVITKGENDGGSVSPDSSQARSVKPVSEMSDDELRAFLNRADMERRYNEIVNPKPQQPQQPQTVQEQKRVDISKPNSVSSLTDDEIRAFLNRVDLEKKYNQIVNPPPPPKQKSAVAEFLKGIALVAVTDVGTKLAKKLLSKAVGLDDDKKEKDKNEKDKNENKKNDDSLNKRVSELERSFKNMSSGGSSGSNSSSKSEKAEKKKENKPDRNDDADDSSESNSRPGLAERLRQRRREKESKKRVDRLTSNIEKYWDWNDPSKYVTEDASDFIGSRQNYAVEDLNDFFRRYS